MTVATKLLAPPVAALAPVSAAQARRRFADIESELNDAGLTDFVCQLRANDQWRDFLLAVFDLSPFLWEVARLHPQLLHDCLMRDADEHLESLIAETSACWRECSSESQVMTRLRLAKKHAALLIGLNEIGANWDGARATLALSRFADSCLNSAISYLLKALHEQGKVVLADRDEPGRDSGLIVLAMGKFGAGELNYSSDIDLILFFEQAGMQIATDDSATLFMRFARSLIRILQERTGDGYVFRTDLRLRPDPGSTPLVIPVGTALNYYEAYGQNWERAAMIKARAAAGDVAAGQAFLKELAPFIWRRHLDFAAIADVHSIKRQIHAHRGHGEIAVAGHNIKLGRGGIREIEFFAQTQQLIAGGRVPALREMRTDMALAALAREGWIDEPVRDALTEAYWKLRSVEHRIQMVADEQSHVLPADKDGLKRIAAMLGMEADAFEVWLTETLRTVEYHYASLFEASPQLSGQGGNLVFTGDDDDPATVETLGRMGYRSPSEVIKIVRGWHYGRFPAVRTAQARELLTELTPALLEVIAAGGDADAILIAFDRFVGGLPAGIQLFSLLKSNDSLLRLLVMILGSAPKMAETVTRRPHVFDGLIDPAYINSVPPREMTAARLELALARAGHYEAVLDAARVFASERLFLLSVRLINGVLTPVTAGAAFTALAEVMVDAILRRVGDELAIRHGRVPGARLCVLGMGKLGSGELTAGSDLDLILLYDHDPQVEFSDGDKPLPVAQYFARLTQRLIAAISARTAEGVVYDLDFRLRPSGNAGPLATEIYAWVKYQREDAWTWEKQALTRARPICGDPDLMAETEACLRQMLGQPMEAEKLLADVREMRDLIDKEKGSTNPFDVKNAPGGLIDIEFIAQWATLSSGLPEGRDRPVSTRAMLDAAPENLLSPADREQLVGALDLYDIVTHFQRICLDEPVTVSSAPEGLRDLICAATGLPDLRTVEGHLKQTQKAVRSALKRILH